MIYTDEIREAILRNRPTSITITFYEPADLPILKKPQQTITFKRIMIDENGIFLFKNKNAKGYDRAELRFLSFYGNGIKSYKLDGSKKSEIPFTNLGALYQDIRNNPDKALKITLREPISFSGKDDELHGKTNHVLNFIEFYKDEVYVSTGTTDRNNLKLSFIAEFYGIASYSFVKKKVTEAQTKLNEVLAQCQNEKIKKEISRRYKNKISRNYYRKIELKDYLKPEAIKIIDDYFNGKYERFPNIEHNKYTITSELKYGIEKMQYDVFVLDIVETLYLYIKRESQTSYHRDERKYVIISSKIAYEI